MTSPSPSPLSPAHRQALAAIVGDDHLRTELPDRLAYQNDCWPRGILLARGRRLHRNLPSAIVQPADEEEVMEIVDWARQSSTPIIPFGAGSGVCGGTVAEDHRAIVVDLKRLDQLVAIDEANATVRAQPGIIGMDLERYLNHAGWTMGHFPSSLYCSSLGGYLAARSAGQLSSRHGKIEDMVLSMRAVDGRGQVVTTAADPFRGAPGGFDAHDLIDQNELIVGSEGTLGLITEALMRIKPASTCRRYRGFQFSRLDLALDAIQEVMQLGLRPAVVRLYDEADSLVASSKKKGQPTPDAPPLARRLADQARQFLPNAIQKPLQKTVEKATQGLLRRAVGNPLMVNAVADLVPGHCLLVVGFEGTNELVDHEADYAFDVFRRYGIDLGTGPGDHWLEHRYSVSYKQSPMYAAGAFVDTMEVSTTWDRLIPLYNNVREAMREHVFVMAHFSHVYPEGSSIYFTFAGFGRDVDDSLARYKATWQAGLDAVADSGASIAHHHGVGQSKAPWTPRDHQGGRPLFERLKDRHDPERILNPGKVYR